MSITKASAQTAVNSGTSAAAAATINQITVAPATATVVAGGGTLGGVTISGITVMSNGSFITALDDTAVTSSGGFVKVTGTGFKTGANVFFNNNLITNTFVSSTQINANIPAIATGTYNFYMFNNDGSGSSWLSGITISGFPTWLVTSYSSGSLTIGTQLSASGDGTLNYYIQSGSANPENLAVNSTGYLSGTVSAEGTYTLTVIVDDAQLQSTQTDISLIVALSEAYFKYNTLLLSMNGTNNANNNSFVDSSSSLCTMTRTSNATQGSFTPFSQTGWSNYFNGAGYIQITSTSGILGSGNYTIEFFCATTDTDWEIIAPEAGVAPALIVSSGSLLYQYQYGVAGPISTSATAILDGLWHHVAVTRNSGNVSVWFDGVYQASATSQTTDYSAFTSNVDIGYGNQSGGRYLTGYLSNFRIVNGTAVYTAGFTPPTSPLTAVAGTTLLTCNSNRFRDTGSTRVLKTAATTAAAPQIFPISTLAPTIGSYGTSTVGGSIHIDGVSSSCVTTTDAGVSLGSGDFTVEAWVYPTNIADGRAAFCIGPRSGTIAMALLCSGTANWQLSAYTAAGATAFSSATPTFLSYPGLNSWSHHAVVRSSGTVSWYINGELVYSAANSTNFTQVGASVGTWDATGAWIGYVSNFRVVVGTAVYTGNFSPPISPISTSGSLSAGSYSSTTNVNTSFSGTNCKLLLLGTNGGFFDATGKNIVRTDGDAKLSTTTYKYGTAAGNFDGTGDWLVIPDLRYQQLGTLPFTIEAWVYKNATGTYGIIGKGTATLGWLISLNTSDQVVFTYGTSTITSVLTVSNTTWTHIAVVREGTSTNQTKIYIGGTNSGTGTVATDFSQTNDMYVGADRTGGNAFNGLLDDVRVTRFYARYTANFTPPTAALRLS